MTWILLSLMYSFSFQSAKIAAMLPPPDLKAVETALSRPTNGKRPVPDAPFTLTIGGVTYKWDTLALFFMPGERRGFRIVSADRDGGFEWNASAGDLSGADAREKTFVAPMTPGLYRLSIRRGSFAKLVSIFVMIPYQGQENVNGYQIGRYPASSHFPKLSLPVGFIEVTPATMNVWLSPHFRLSQFVCHQAGDFPKYVVLREKLIRKLEALINLVQKRGINCPRLELISGYRTPSFNSRNGNAENSVHTYGGAADIYIDADRDGVMDDLNGNRRHDIGDAVKLYDIVDQLEREMPEFVGGNGYYPGNGAHGPFVHTDVRGERSRWHE